MTELGAPRLSRIEVRAYFRPTLFSDGQAYREHGQGPSSAPSRCRGHPGSGPPPSHSGAQSQEQVGESPDYTYT